MCFALPPCLAMLISGSDCWLNKSCHKVGVCSKPPHAQLSRLLTALSSWSVGQGKYSRFTQCSHTALLCKHNHRHVKFSIVTVYKHFSYIRIRIYIYIYNLFSYSLHKNFLPHEINILKTVPVYVYDSVRNKKTQYIPKQFMWLFCAHQICSEFDKPVRNYPHRVPFTSE